MRLYSDQAQITYIKVKRRSSTEEQARQWHSIDRQELSFQSFEKRTGAVCVGDYTIDCSAKGGKNFRSPEFKQLWRQAKALKNKLTHVLWVDVDRYGRSGVAVYWFEQFQGIGVEVNFIDEWFDFSVPESIARFYGRLGDAQAEVTRLSIRTCKGKAGLRESGYYNDTLPAPWQYEAERREDGRKYAQLIPEIAQAYKVATMAFKQGKSQAAAMRTAKEATGYKISSSAFSRWLLMPLAYGFLPVWDNYKLHLHARKMVDLIPCQNVPPLFDDLNQFYEIRERLRQTSPGSAGSAREPFNADFPLSYPCPCCGGPIRGYYANPKRKTPTPYYDCPKCGKESRVHRKQADAFVIEFLSSIEINPAELDLVKEGAKRALHLAGVNDSKEREKLNKALSAVKVRIDYLYDNLHQYEPDVFTKSMQRLEGERRQIEAQLTNLEQKRSAGLDMRSKLLDFAQNMGQWYAVATGEQKANLLSAITPEGYTVTKKGFRTWYINRILQSMATISADYIVEKGENKAFALQSPRGGRLRADIRTLQADIIALQNFFATLKAA